VLSIVSPDGFPFSIRTPWQQNFQVRGDLVSTEEGWALIPRRLVGGFELPQSRLAGLRENMSKARWFRRIAQRELAQRG
jgi:hypothetical protein